MCLCWICWQARRAAESKVFKFSTESGTNLVNSFTISGFVDLGVQSFTVATVPKGQSFEQMEKSFDVQLASAYDDYVVMAVELFDNTGTYLRNEVDINFCITAHDPSLTVQASRLPVGATEWVEVTNIVQV